jgi:hypothetical protein
LLIGRVFLNATSVARNRLDYAWNVVEIRFDAPKASTGEYCRLELEWTGTRRISSNRPDSRQAQNHHQKPARQNRSKSHYLPLPVCSPPINRALLVIVMGWLITLA